MKQKISNHKLITELERVVEITGFNVNFKNNEIVFFYVVRYFKGDKELKFIENLPTWKIDNSYKVTIRNEDMSPKLIENSEGEMVENNVPAFDYFIDLFSNYKDILSNYILLDDSNGRFDV